MKALIADHIHEDGIFLLKEFAEVTEQKNMSIEELQEALMDKDILIGRSTPKTPAISYPLLENAPLLKVIGFASIGIDRIDTHYVRQKRVAIEHLPGVNTRSVTEHAFALILASRRCVVPAFDEMRKGNWNKSGYMHARDIKGNTIGIIGLGRIGTSSAITAKLGFSMEVLAYDPYVSDKECERRGAKKTDLDELLNHSDVVLIHAPLTEETYHLIGKDELARMREYSMIVNVGRGGIVDEEALYEALSSRKIECAALDVQENEPFNASPLLSLSNFIATPHLAGLTRNYFEKAGVAIVRQCLLQTGVSEAEIDRALITIQNREGVI